MKVTTSALRSPDLELPPVITLTQVGQFLVSVRLRIRDTPIQLPPELRIHSWAVMARTVSTT